MPRKKAATLEVPPSHNWRTTDQDEINRRRLRAQSESFRIFNTSPEHPIFSNFKVCSGSGMTYQVEVRDIFDRQFACECVDFSINGLGTCKHVEAVLLHLQSRYKKLFHTAARNGSSRLDVVPEPAGALRLTGFTGTVPVRLRKWFGADGCHRNGAPQETLSALEQVKATGMPELRLSQELGSWLENQRRTEERKQLRHEYEQKVQSGRWPAQETKVPLFPYQREGMLHLAFTERALLADEMGLGKTIQAIAACALVHRLGRAARALVVTPASLKTEWEDQIQRFTDLKYQLVFGGRSARLKAYERAGAALAANGAQKGDGPPAGIFFTIVNYEQMLADALEVNERLRPDIVILDEAQRIKNWSTKTTQAIKRLQSRYAFVLTGTPIENRIDELYSLMGFLDPSALGPLFRFNREFYELDDRGRPMAYRNLEKLHERIKPYMLRRRKSDVETELPERTDRTFFVRLSDAQQGEYDGHEGVVARLAQAAKRRPLTQQEQDKLMRHMAMMRMVCDTNYILNLDDRSCPKLAELEKILEECRDNREVKVIIFSEWERMLELVRDLCRKLDLGFAWHTGTVPQQRRRAEINLFKSDPLCRVFLSTDSGAAGLNLQNASVVINCDLPWNPAKLEQRIARAWRKHQTRPVTVINLVSQNTIEHRMLETLAQKQALADGVLDHIGNFNSIKLRQGRQAFLERLQQFITLRPAENNPVPAPPALPADRAFGFSQAAHQRINGALVRCEERYPNEGSHSVLYVVVERDAPQWREKLACLHQDYFPPAQSDPLAPVRLEVIDRATDEALNRLAELGLVVPTTRASRALFPLDTAANEKPALSESERQQADEHRQKAGRKIKMAILLSEGGLTEEARNPLLEAILHFGRALSVENLLPAPADVAQALLPPLAQAWMTALMPLREFVRDPAAACKPLIEHLQKV